MQPVGDLVLPCNIFRMLVIFQSPNKPHILNRTVPVTRIGGLSIKVTVCNASTSSLTTTWDEISYWLINKDLCRNNFFAHF